METQTGRIIKVNSKGYGFIELDEGHNNIFFHASGVEKPTAFDDLREGDRVVFCVIDNERGQQMCINVVLDFKSQA